MAIIDYSKQDEYDLTNSGQDCMGWTVVDQAGNELGKVTEMLIETDQMHVDSIIVNNSKRVPAADIALRDNRVVVRGVREEENHAATETATATAAATAAPQTYNRVERDANARRVAGVTREANDDEISIPIIEEKMVVGKRTVEGGSARIRTVIEDRPVEQQVNLREERVTVERHAVNRPLDASATANAFQEGTIDITTQAEVPVVAKETRVVEEVHIGKETTEHTETVRDTVKRTEVDVDEITGENVAPRTGKK